VAHTIELSDDDIRLLRGIREDAASWQQAHAERLMLDRLIAGPADTEVMIAADESQTQMTEAERDELLPRLRAAMSNIGSVRPWTSGRWDPGIEIIIRRIGPARSLLRGLRMLAELARPPGVKP